MLEIRLSKIVTLNKIYGYMSEKLRTNAVYFEVVKYCAKEKSYLPCKSEVRNARKRSPGFLVDQ